MDEKTLIKQRLDIKDVVAEYLDLKKQGRNFQAICPFHNEDSPSFSVSPELQIYKCFGCGESGDIFSFVQKIEGFGFRDAIVRLAEKANVELKDYRPDPKAKKKAEFFEQNNLATKFYNYLLTSHPSGKNALSYLTNERSFTLETINEFQLGYAPDAWDTLQKFLTKKRLDLDSSVEAGLLLKRKSGNGYFDKFRKRVLFPLIDTNGRVVGYSGRALDKDQKPKYLNTSESPIFHKSDFIYGLNTAKISLKHKGAIIVEGQTDVISAYQIGITNVVAPLGTALTTGQLRLLSRFTKEIIFCLDTDEAGINAAIRGIELAEPLDFNIKVAQIPLEYKDLDEFIKADPKKVTVMFNDAVPIYDFFISSALKTHDVTTPYGKKAAMKELVVRFSSVQSDVLLDHYIKKIADSLDLDLLTVKDLILKKRNIEQIEITGSISNAEISSLEELFLFLLLQSEVDISRDYVYKLNLKDFSTKSYKSIFIAFKEYVEQQADQIDISDFINSLQEPLKKECSDIVLKDFKVALNDKKLLVKELDKAYNRLMKLSAKKQIAVISKQLKLAEAKKDIDSIQELTKQLQELSKYLI